MPRVLTKVRTPLKTNGALTLVRQTKNKGGEIMKKKSETIFFSRLYPEWWHVNGAKMELKKSNSLSVRIAASAAKLVIRKASLVYPKKFREGWYVDWKVVQCYEDNEGTAGRVFFTDEDLLVAFGLADKYKGDYEKGISKMFTDRYGGTCGYPGKFIRWKEFLNIPCPGIGDDGDPNISIELDEEIKRSVSHLLSK